MPLPAATSPLLGVRALHKAFGAQTALEHVDLTLNSGEIHALVGENGAGKSTLIRMLSGVYPPTSGELMWEGVPTTFSSPAAAQRAGIRVLHQERQLVPGFSGLENLYLGAPYPLRAGRVDWGAMRRQAASLQQELGLNLPLERSAQELTPTQRTLTEVLRAVLIRGRLLILDEPTASLAHEDAERVFALIRRLSREGTAVLYVSHRLEEVLDLSDRVTVLRGGQVAARFERGESDARQLVQAMSGDELPGRKSAHVQGVQTPSAAPLLSVSHLATRDARVQDVTLELHAGEILGIYGLAGAGRTELLEALAGLRPLRSGTVDTAAGTPPVRVLIPEDRRAQGLIGSMSVLENVTLATLGRHARRGVLNGGSERRAAQDAIDTLHIRTTGPAQPVSELSGGNQQKVVFARALAQQPGLWLCDEPTQAVDVMTRRAVHDLLRSQAAAGAGVVFVTSDLSELLEVCTRAVVLREGRSVATLAGDALHAQAVLQACYQTPQHAQKAAHAAQ